MIFKKYARLQRRMVENRPCREEGTGPEIGSSSITITGLQAIFIDFLDLYF
jgi:hypothetical protein